jgi:hypothetical protein
MIPVSLIVENGIVIGEGRIDVQRVRSLRPGSKESNKDDEEYKGFPMYSDWFYWSCPGEYAVYGTLAASSPWDGPSGNAS